MVFVNSSHVFSEKHDPQSGYESGEEKETRQKEALYAVTMERTVTI